MQISRERLPGSMCERLVHTWNPEDVLGVMLLNHTDTVQYTNFVFTSSQWSQDQSPPTGRLFSAKLISFE